MSAYNSNTCPNCNAVMETGSSPSCPSCGAVIVASPLVAQMQLPVPAIDDAITSGPLLTNHVQLDIALGQTGEFVGFALFLYATFLFYRCLYGYPAPVAPTLMTVVGLLATGVFLFKYADTMRQRYPNFARGWQAGRNTWGKIVEPLISTSFGLGILIVLMPVTWMLFDWAKAAGPLAWTVVAGIAYVIGTLIRRIGRPLNGNTKP